MFIEKVDFIYIRSGFVVCKHWLEYVYIYSIIRYVYG